MISKDDAAKACQVFKTRPSAWRPLQSREIDQPRNRRLPVDTPNAEGRRSTTASTGTTPYPVFVCRAREFYGGGLVEMMRRQWFGLCLRSIVVRCRRAQYQSTWRRRWMRTYYWAMHWNRTDEDGRAQAS